MANVGVIPYAEKGDVGNKKPDDLAKCKIVNVGDFVINSMNYYIGSYGESPHHGVCSPVYIVLTPKQDAVVSRYAFRIFEIGGFQEYAQSYGNGILEHRRSINWDILKTIPVPIPPLPEQRTIASFLDAETSKIDGLVSEQRRLIELLKEKRQAVISHAVTKGLDSDVKMKESGIEWLGEVPEHWEVTQAKRVAAVFVPQRNKPELNDLGDGVCWITMEQMQKTEIVNSQLFVSEESLANAGSKVLKSGAVIASCVGQFEVASIIGSMSSSTSNYRHTSLAPASIQNISAC
jgi:type I restriction enzyme S subunit